MSESQSSGGLTRWAPDPVVDTGAIPTGPQETSRVVEGTQRWSGSDGSTQALDVVRVSGANEPTQGGGVMGSARSNTGSSRIDSTTTVSIDGMRTSLAVAESMGLIRQGPNGWENTPAGAGSPNADQGPATQQAPESQSTVEMLSPEIEADWDRSLAAVPQSTFDAGAALASLAVLDQTSYDGWDRLTERVAKESGIEPEQAASLVSDAYLVHERLTANAIARVGIGADEKENFYRYLQQSKPKELSEATRSLVNMRNTSSFKALAILWKTEQANGQLSFYRSQGFDGSYVDPKTGDLMVAKAIGGKAVRARDL